MDMLEGRTQGMVPGMAAKSDAGMSAALPPRARTHQVSVGGVKVGGGAPVAVQSMTNVRMLQTDRKSVG